MEIGLNAAVVVNKIEYWIEKGYGEEIDGVVYIWNPMRVWAKQFPWMSLKTLNRVFDKLIDLKIIFKRKHGRNYDQTRSYGINYEHPIMSKCLNPFSQNDQMESVKMGKCISTDTNQKEQQRPTQRRKISKPTSRNPYPNSTREEWKEVRNKVSPSKYKKDWKQVEQWLVGQTDDFQKAVEEYAELQTCNPKRRVKHPVAYKMSILWQIWRKENGKTSHCDFEYVDKSEIKVRCLPTLKVDYRVPNEVHLDNEMQRLYEEGGIE
jgi:hypothetical protein